ncbi:MAG: DUF2383 domain-containing protein [Flavobacteriales bacterium]
MQHTYEKLYHRIKKVLEKNVDAQAGYLKAADIAQHEDVKLFFKQKAYHRGLFNERLMFEVNYSFDAPKIEGSITTDNSRNFYMDIKEGLLNTSDESLLEKSIKGDKIALKDYEDLLQHSMLPLSIRFIVKEQVTVIKLDRLKMEQLINFSI